MKLVVDVKDSKADLLLEFLRALSYVKVKRVPSGDAGEHTGKAAILAGVKEAVEEMKLVKAGKLKGRDAMDFLNEL